MSSDTVAPDIGAILEQLRTEVRARRSAAGGSELSPVERDLRRSLDDIELYRVVSAHWPLKGRSLPERALTLINKLVRRFLRWYINPIVEQQNAYNDAVARALRLLAEAYNELGVELRSVQTSAEGPGSGPAIPPADASRAAIQQLVEQYGRSEPPARFIELELVEQERQLALRREVHAHWPLTGRTALDRGVALVHKLTRQYLRWLINPIVEQQNAANTAIAGAVRNLARLDADRRAELAALRAAARVSARTGEREAQG